jgi:hypothetical protein
LTSVQRAQKGDGQWPLGDIALITGHPVAGLVPSYLSADFISSQPTPEGYSHNDIE